MDFIHFLYAHFYVEIVPQDYNVVENNWSEYCCIYAFDFLGFYVNPNYYRAPQVYSSCCFSNPFIEIGIKI